MMRNMRMNIIGLMALAILVGPGLAKDAGAKVRVKATIRTPNVRVHVGNTSNCYRSYKKRYLPVRKHLYYRITEQDRKIARRLARYTGVPVRKLVRLRHRGYSWFEIGHWLYLPRPAILAARHQRTWQRFLREESRFAGCDCDQYRWRIVHSDGLYDDD